MTNSTQHHLSLWTQHNYFLIIISPATDCYVCKLVISTKLDVFLFPDLILAVTVCKRSRRLKLWAVIRYLLIVNKCYLPFLHTTQEIYIFIHQPNSSSSNSFHDHHQWTLLLLQYSSLLLLLFCSPCQPHRIDLVIKSTSVKIILSWKRYFIEPDYLVESLYLND